MPAGTKIGLRRLRVGYPRGWTRCGRTAGGARATCAGRSRRAGGSCARSRIRRGRRGDRRDRRSRALRPVPAPARPPGRPPTRRRGHPLRRPQPADGHRQGAARGRRGGDGRARRPGARRGRLHTGGVRRWRRGGARGSAGPFMRIGGPARGAPSGASSPRSPRPAVTSWWPPATCPTSAPTIGRLLAAAGAATTASTSPWRRPTGSAGPRLVERIGTGPLEAAWHDGVHALHEAVARLRSVAVPVDAGALRNVNARADLG